MNNGRPLRGEQGQTTSFSACLPNPSKFSSALFPEDALPASLLIRQEAEVASETIFCILILLVEAHTKMLDIENKTKQCVID